MPCGECLPCSVCGGGTLYDNRVNAFVCHDHPRDHPTVSIAAWEEWMNKTKEAADRDARTVGS